MNPGLRRFLSAQGQHTKHTDDSEYCSGGGKKSLLDQRKRVRCPVCNRRLLLAEVHCIGGELLYYKVPAHKLKVRRRRVESRDKGRSARGK